MTRSCFIEAPPFKAGAAAYHAGQPVTANPHDPAAPVAPDDWPGPFEEWRKGWRFAKMIEEHAIALGE